MIGTTVSHYKILEKLGEGGMGVVYKAQDTKLDRFVALKFLPDRISDSKDDLARFIREAKAAAMLNHPNIATIYEIAESDEKIFLVLEYISGGTLRSKIKLSDDDISIEDILQYGLQMAEGLAAAHHAGIIHRDVKNDNVMLTSDGHIKLTDFGLAKVRDSERLTGAGSTPGTAAYMAPEQLLGKDADKRSDLFSLGVVLYELLTRQLPFRGEHPAALTYSIVNENPQAIVLFRQNVPEALAAVIHKCLEKDPSTRYQSAEELVRDMKQLLIGMTMSHISNTLSVKPPFNLSKWLIAGTAVIAMTILLYFLMPSSKKSVEEIKTIAILPFTDMSPNKDQEYFSDGLAEELLNVLARNPKLRVTSRTSSFSFKGKDADIKTIASKLNVKHILEGSVRKSGNTLRITAQLIDVENDAHLWSNTYDGKMDDIFAVQDKISQSVARELETTLFSGKSEPKTINPEAYNYYLLGKYFYEFRGKENLLKAIEYYEQAIKIDSNYAQAWVGLAFVHSSQSATGLIPVYEGFSKARKEAERALSINPNSAEAHSRIGWIKEAYDWDWEGAEAAYRRALELEPNNIIVLQNAASLSKTFGRFEEGISLLKRAIQLDPLRASTYINLGLYYMNAGFYDEAMVATKKCLNLNPKFPGAHARMSRFYLLKGILDSALVEIDKEAANQWKMFAHSLVYYAMGRMKEADFALENYIKERQNVSAFQIAEIYAYRGEKDKAFEWLERAYTQRDGGLTELKGDPLLRNLEKDPRYTEFLKKMKLPL